MKASKEVGRAVAQLVLGVGLLTGVSTPVYAQQPTQLVAQMQAQFPDEKAVYLDYRTDLTLELKGDSVVVLARHH